MNTWHILAFAAAALTLVAVPGFAAPHFNAEQPRQLALAMPQPTYPESARQHHITGSGVFKVFIHVKTGCVKSVKIFRSTGNRSLDAAAVWALLQWRFKPGVLPTMRQLYPQSKEPDADEDACVGIPISFVFSGGGAQVH